jgi:hypothetical protein
LIYSIYYIVMMHLARQIRYLAKYVRVEYCSRCDFHREFERLEIEIGSRDKSTLIQGIKTQLRISAF